jgi:hypothetical protein
LEKTIEKNSEHTSSKTMTETNSTSNTNFNIPSSQLSQLNQKMNIPRNNYYYMKSERTKTIRACITVIDDNCLTEVLTCLLTPENASVAPLVALIT